IEGIPAYWEEAERRILAVINGPLRAGIERNEVQHLSVFGLARIPLLVLLGYHLDDKIPVDLYQKHRDSDESWSWDPSAETSAFEITRLDGDPEKLVLVCSLSGTIAPGDLPPAITENATIYTILPTGQAPNRNILRSRASLDAFTATYH